MNEPQVMRLGNGQVLLRGAALRMVTALAEAGVTRFCDIDGRAVPAAVRALLDEMRAEAGDVRADVRSDVREVPGDAPSGHDERISVAEAARALGCSERHVRRIALSLNGRRDGHQWTFDPLVVAEYRMAVR